MRAIQEIISTPCSDGFSMSFDKSKKLALPHMKEPGYRIFFYANFERMKTKFHIDVVAGDVVTPKNHSIRLLSYKGKPMFEGEILLLVYSAEAIFSEKMVAILTKGPEITRMKDYHDVLLLLREEGLINSVQLKEVITSTFKNFATNFQAIEFEDDGIFVLQGYWNNHLSNLKAAEDLDLPQEFSSVIMEINTYISEL